MGNRCTDVEKRRRPHRLASNGRADRMLRPWRLSLAGSVHLSRKRKIEDIWDDTVAFFNERNPNQIEKANKDPKKKMALIFRWYLGLASRWSRDGNEDRKMDYQIWCGPSMGAFNEWAAGTYLQDYTNRHAADIGWQLLKGSAYRYRVQALKMQGVVIPPGLETYVPERIDP